MIVWAKNVMRARPTHVVKFSVGRREDGEPACTVSMGDGNYFHVKDADVMLTIAEDATEAYRRLSLMRENDERDGFGEYRAKG